MAGTVFGCFLIGGVGYAADEIEIPVSFPAIHYAVDGETVNSVPQTIRYKQVNYVPVRFIADILGKEVVWDGDNHTIHLNSVQPVEYELIEAQSVPEELQRWVERSIDKKTTQVRLFQDRAYILITRGEKHSGGYDISIDHVYRNDRGMWVYFTFIDPPKGEPVTAGMTYPYVLLQLKQPYFGPIEFRESNGREVSELEGLTYLPPVYKQTDHLLLFEPETQGDWLKVRGAVRSFEGAVQFSKLDADGHIMEKRWLDSGGSETEWGYFEILFTDVDKGDSLQLQTYTPDERTEMERLRFSVGDWIR